MLRRTGTHVSFHALRRGRDRRADGGFRKRSQCGRESPKCSRIGAASNGHKSAYALKPSGSWSVPVLSTSESGYDSWNDSANAATDFGQEIKDGKALSEAESALFSLPRLCPRNPPPPAVAWWKQLRGHCRIRRRLTLRNTDRPDGRNVRAP